MNFERIYLGVKELLFKGVIVVVGLMILGVLYVIDNKMEELFVFFVKLLGKEFIVYVYSVIFIMISFFF